MAEKFTELEENQICPICVDLFTEPVTLPCQGQHRFCRQCLKSYAEHCESLKPNGDNATSSIEGQIICCPVCRSRVDLGIKGVEGLPVHVTFTSMVEKYCNKTKLGEALKCSLCEDGVKKPAVNFCVTCYTFYCHDCVTLFHPMIGMLKEHNLITAEEYVCGQKITERAVFNNNAMDTSELCDDHHVEILVFCGRCQRPLCRNCFEAHDGHPLKDVSVLYRENARETAEKVAALNELKDDVEKLFVELSKFREDIEEKKSLHIFEIEKAYQEIIENAREWRRDCLKTVEETHEEWQLACVGTTKNLKIKTEEIASLLRLSNEQLHGSKVHAIKDHDQLMTRITDLSSSTKDDLQRQKRVITKCRDDMDCDVVIPKKLYLREEKILTPRLRFTEKLSDCVIITDNHTVLVNVKQEEKMFTGALTDGRFQTGNYYWKLDLRFRVKKTQKKTHLVYSAGVVRKGSDIGGYVGCNKLSWGVSVSYINSQYQSICCNDGKVLSTPVPVYPNGLSIRGTVRQGFYLNCEERTLTIIDHSNNRVLHTFKGLDLSEPLIPAVSVDNFDLVDVSVCLIPCNLSVLLKILKNTVK